MVETLYESWDVVYSEQHIGLDKSYEWWGQLFTIGATGPNKTHKFTRLKIKVYRVGSPGIVNCYIAATSGGVPPPGSPGTHLASTSFDGDSITTSSPGEELFLTGWSATVIFDINTQYAFYFNCPGSDVSNKVYCVEDVNLDAPPYPYPGGDFIGHGLDPTFQRLAADAFWFKEYGEPVPQQEATILGNITF